MGLSCGDEAKGVQHATQFTGPRLGGASPVARRLAGVPEPLSAIEERMLAAALERAAEMLDRHGEFYPFAVVVGVAGDLEHQMKRPQGAGDFPKPDLVHRELVAALRDYRDGYLGVAVVANATAAFDGADGVRIELETPDSARHLLITYRRRLLLRRLRWLERREGPARPQVWA